VSADDESADENRSLPPAAVCIVKSVKFILRRCLTVSSPFLFPTGWLVFKNRTANVGSFRY